MIKYCANITRFFDKSFYKIEQIIIEQFHPGGKKHLT